MSEFKIIAKLILVEKKDMLLSILFGFLAGISTISLFANSGYLISKAALLPPLYMLTLTIAFMKLFSIVRAFSRYGERYFSHRATFTILTQLRSFFYKKLEPLAPTIFQRYRSGDLLARIVGDVESLQHFFLRVCHPPIVMVLVFFITISFTSIFSIEIALTLVVGLLLTGFLIPLSFHLKQRETEVKVRKVRGELSTESTEFMSGFLDLKLYHKLTAKENELLSISHSYIEKQASGRREELSSYTLNNLVSLLVSWFVLSLGAFFVTTNQLDGLFLAMLVLISLTIFENSSQMTEFPIYLKDSKKAAHRLFSVVEDTKEESEEQPTCGYRSHKPPSIHLKNVSFRFPGEVRPTLHNLNLYFPAGTKTAIIGPSGSGKSTVLALLLKLYKSYEGNIMFDDSNLTKLNENSIWNKINPVFQSNHFFSGTVRENLLIKDDAVSDEEIFKVLSIVNLEDLPLDAPIYEKGGNLSGGEKQRLAIARAMLKGGTLWLMDEPTSSVDSLTERRILHHLYEQSKDNTVILISHKLSGLEIMDQIIVMVQGKIIESGTYQQLMKNKGYFYEMKQIENSILF